MLSPLRFAILLSASTLIVFTAKAPSPALTLANKPVLPEPHLVRGLGASQLALIADLYWIREIAFEVETRTAADGKSLLALGELIEAVDPDFPQVYWYTGLNGVIRQDTGWANALEGAEHLRRGLRRFPDHHLMVTLLSYNLMAYQQDLSGAAEVLRAASRVPGAPSHFGLLATRLFAVAGNYEASRDLTRELLTSAADDETRAFFEERAKDIELEELLAEVDAAGRRYKQGHGESPATLNDLWVGGYLNHPIVDPFGGTILLDSNGIAHSTARPQRLKVHE